MTVVPDTQRRLWPLMILLFVFVVALVPRSTPGDFVTVDEGVHWFERTQAFARAIRQGDHALTYQSGHPGVSTMWLGTLGEWLYQATGERNTLFHRQMLRLPVAIMTSFCVALAYLFLRRLFGGRIALAAALLWATDPFLVAHSQLLHLDALLASFMVTSVLAALSVFGSNRLSEKDFIQSSSLRLENDLFSGRGSSAATTREKKEFVRALPSHSPFQIVSRKSWVFIFISACFAGLAFLTKSPSVLLLPFIGLIVFIARYRSITGTFFKRLFTALGRTVPFYLAWIVVAGVVWIALWPATWADLPGVIQKIADEARTNGGEAHGLGNFFLGQSIDDPGPLFYPATVVMRLTPWVLVGLFLAPGALRQWQPGDQRRIVFTLLVLFVLLFLAPLSILAKKFDRYALPIFPALQIIAALGLVWALSALAAWLGRRLAFATTRLGQIASWSLVVGMLAWNLAAIHPYELAYFNPLLGGGPVAARTVPVGWGEGYDLAARSIMKQYDACERPIAVWYGVLIEDLTCWNLIPMRDFEQGQDAGYVILYIDQIQRGYYPEATARLYGVVPPLETVQIAGIDYAAIYQLPPPRLQPVEAQFGSAMRLWGYDIDTSSLNATGTLTLTLQWQALEAIPEDFDLFVHVLNEGGQQVGQVFVPAGDPRVPTGSWQPHQYVVQQQLVPLGPGLPAGRYWVAIGIADPATQQRLPLAMPSGSSPQPPLDDGPNVLFLQAFDIS